MFILIKQISTLLLSFSGSLATKYRFLNTEPRITRSTVTDLNPVQLNHYPSRSCDVNYLQKRVF